MDGSRLVIDMFIWLVACFRLKIGGAGGLSSAGSAFLDGHCRNKT